MAQKLVVHEDWAKLKLGPVAEEGEALLVEFAERSFNHLEEGLNASIDVRMTFWTADDGGGKGVTFRTSGLTEESRETAAAALGVIRVQSHEAGLKWDSGF